MHEILFRAKAINRDPNREYRTDYKNGDWVYGLISKLYDEECYKRCTFLFAEMTNESGVSGIDVDYKTIGQFTGLLDKNGNKIFEGDILKNTLDSSISIVEWSEAHTAFTLKQIGLFNLGAGGTIYGFPRIGHEVYLIIGNIHDNPELIGGDE